MADALLSSSIASLKTKILSQVTSATIIEVAHLARSAKQIGLGDDTDIETAFNSRVNQLYSTATPADIKILATAIKQLKNDPTVSSLITNSDDITEGSLNTFHTTARVNTELGAFSTNIVPDGNVTRNVGSAGNKLNTVFASTVTGLTTPVNSDDATSKTYVDTAITNAGGANLGAVGEHIVPTADVTYDLGSSTNKFRDLYLSGNTLNLGTQTLSSDSTGIIVPELTIGTGTNKIKMVAKADGTLETTGTNSGGTTTSPVKSLTADDISTFVEQSDIDTSIANLVDTAPATLNTLNELAAALGDDANFSTTITNSVAAKLPLAGGTMTGAIDMGSNDITTTGKIKFANVYSTEADLPSASTYHGMFAHVHSTGAGYFAHAGSWVKLASETYVGNQITAAGSYSDASVNSHLNQSTATTGQTLIWNGTDYSWGAQSFASLTSKPTTIAGYGITDAGGGNVVEYTSSPNASVNDIVMLNSNGTVTPIAVTTYKTNKDVPQAQIIPNSTGWVYNQTNGAYDQSSDNAVLFPLGISNKYFFMGRDDSSGTAELSGAIVDWTGTSTNSGSWTTWNNPGWTYGTKYSGQSGFGGFARPALSNKEKPFVLPSPLDANKFLLVQRLHDSEKVIAQIGTITGSTVAWSNHAELDIAIHSSSYVRHLYDPANSSSGNYAFYTVVNSNSAGRVRIVRGVWDGNTTITFGPGTSSGDHNGWQFPSDDIDPRSISFSKITANRCTAVNKTTGEIAIYDLSTTINSITSAVTKGTAQPLSSFQWDGTDLAAHTSWNYNRDEFVVWWRTAGNTQDNNSIMQNYEVSSTNPVYPIAKGTNLNLANHIQFKNGDFEFISGSDTIFTTYLQEWIGLGGEHSHRAVISIDPSSGNLTTLDKDIAYSHSTGEPGVFTLGNVNNAQFEGTISVDHFRKGQAVMTNPHYNNSVVWQVAGSPIVGTYVQSNIDATKIHGIATASGSYPDVTVEGGIHTGLSGLTAGTTYFVLENGTISATADTHNARLGIAMTSTSLAVDLVNELTSTSLATYATKSYVDTATANLVDSAPATLDTLNELAAALGDDANFSTTITNSLANKADTSSLATVATSGSYNDLSNQPTIPTAIDQTANVLSGASPQIDLTKNYFKIDLSSDTTFSTTGSPTNGEWYEGKIEVKGNASQLTHNLVTNPSNQISNWRTTASTPSISGFYSQGYSAYGFFAVSPNGQYAINGSYVGTGDYRFQIIEFSTPGDITSGSLVHQSGNVHGTISWQRSNVYFATNTKFVTSSGHVITVPSGSITTSNPYGTLPVVDTAGQGNWSSDGTKYIGVKEAQNQDPIFRLYTASTPFYANTLTLTQSYTFNKWGIGGDHSLKIDHGNNVHISDDGLNLYTAGFYQLNNWSNQMMMHFTLSTAFDLSTMSHTGNNLTGSYATFGHGRFIEGGAQYWAPKSNGVYGFQNLNTPAVLNTTTWPGTWGWEGGVSHSAPPNNETDIINFVSTDGGSTFNAWVEKDSDKSAGFDGQYSSLTGAPTLATVATSGSYNDLTNQPTIPSISGLATETYVDTATANLVDSAPATLDTLNELAAALGDDANFSTTITNQIAAKADAYSIATVTASGGNFYIDGVQQVTLSFEPGRTYRFDQADSSNSSHPLRFSTTSDGTHGSGSEYTTGVTTNGTAGSAGAYVQIAITHATPTLYYYCVNHSGMGAGSVVGNFSGAYSDLTGAPSIPSAYTDSAVDTHLNQSSATTGQLLSWNGSDYTWTTAASGVTTGSTAPSSPSAGDLWFDTDDLIMYVYYNDGSSNQWVEANSAQVGGSSVTNSDTAPSGAAAGDLWFKTDTADLFLYYTDADSSQWVQVGGAGQSTSGSGVQSSIETGNTSITTTDTGSDGTILFTTEGTARWEITSSGNLLPKTNAAFDIGSASYKVRDLYLDDSTIHLGDTPLSASNIDRSMEVYTDVAAPSSATDIGTKGDVRIVGNYMYVCINTNTWVRTQIETSW